MKESKGPTLTDAKGLGGVTAQDGFDYQVWDAMIRIPRWIRNPAFEGLALEVLEDLEARFFAPHAPREHLLERFQAKSGALGRGELIEVLTSFRTFELAHPGAARVHALVTPALPATLTWMARDPGRVRRARPFYGPFADIRAASDEKLKADLIGELGEQLGSFFADYGEVDLRSLPDRAHAETAFGAALHDAFPDLDVGQRMLRDAFAALGDVLGQSRGVMVTRRQLLDVLKTALGRNLVEDVALPVHVRSDRNGESPCAVEIDASRFSGGDSAYPDPTYWAMQLRGPLETTATWARTAGYQRITLSGSFRLSTAFTLGWVFRSAVGFDLDIPTRSGSWATDDHASGAALPWTVSQPQALSADRLIVAIGVLRNPTAAILQTASNVVEANLLLATLPQAVTTGKEAQVFVQTIKTSVAQAVARFQPAGIDLYYIGPAALAVALGHRWNAFPPTQLWEFLSAEGRYTRTITIG